MEHEKIKRINQKILKSFQFIYFENIGIRNLYIVKAYLGINKRNVSIEKPKKVKIDLTFLNEKEINLIDGILFINNIQKKEELSKDIDFILYIEKKIKKLNSDKFCPIIMKGNKSKIINYLNNINYKIEDISKNMNIQNIEGSSKENIDFLDSIKELIKMVEINFKYQNFLINNNITENQYAKSLCDTSLHLLKCAKCNEIPEISIDRYSYSIYLFCNKCNTEKKYDFNEYDKIKNKILLCSVCKKDINKKNSVNFCLKCKNHICKDCTKKHIQKEHKSIENGSSKKCLYPNNLINFICDIHEKICCNYCLDCHKNICPKCEMEYHKDHITKIFNNAQQIQGFIKIQNQNLIFEKEGFEKMQKLMEDCLYSLRIYFKKLLFYKKKEIDIKEQMIKELEIFKYNNTLLENIKNLEFEQYDLYYDFEAPWNKKLNYIFEYFKQPIKIKDFNLCQKENLKGPYNNIQEVNINKDKAKENITDLCFLNNYINKNYFAVSFNNGLLKVYNDNFEDRIPKLVIKEFESSEGINYLHKSLGNSLLVVGNSKIIKIFFSEDFKEYKIIDEIKFKEQLFKMAIEINSMNVLITINNLNQIKCYDFKNGKELLDVKDDISFKEILNIERLSDSKIILYISKKNLFDDIDLDLRKNSIIDEYSYINNSFDIENNIIELNKYEHGDLEYEIIEFEMIDDKIKIKKNHPFSKEILYLGKVNDELILLYNKIEIKIIIYNIISYSMLSKYNFDSSLKPIISYPLNRTNLKDLLILCEEGYLLQCRINSKNDIIYIINKIKIIHNNPLINSIVNDKINEINKNKIVKMIKFNKRNFLFLTQDNSIYNLNNN